MIPIKTTPLEPVEVTVIGTGTGDGNIKSGTLLQTPDHQPNVVYNVITPVFAIFIRVVNSYLTILIGLMGVGITTNAIPATDFYHLFMKCAGLSIGGAAFGLIKDLITVFSGLEKKYPLMTGSV